MLWFVQIRQHASFSDHAAWFCFPVSSTWHTLVYHAPVYPVYRYITLPLYEIITVGERVYIIITFCTFLLFALMIKPNVSLIMADHQNSGQYQCFGVFIFPRFYQSNCVCVCVFRYYYTVLMTTYRFIVTTMYYTRK